MIAKLRTEAKHAFETNETNFKLLNNEVFGKTIENVRKHGDINLVKQTEEEIIRIRTLSYNKNVFRIFIRNRNEKNTTKNE